ncbi:DNA/RNA non-specific endonuclease [Tunicatimonas pelagia]|uniref:DNA/RNA non-specific endonuclease n=1 Tax=Tunicatimonas pelagia TaxID=931531 RepID=UPI00266714BF|nr:DNA/RNA non-specific endonuclease [Tunicatimonas pelagia]WKN44577.1 DNA/RNA non-specific endonuclease [Tunicatimonas pelagia]
MANRSKKRRSPSTTRALLITALIVLGLILLLMYLKRQNQTSAPEIVGFSYLPSVNNGFLVQHQHYTLSYVEEHEQAEWVAYKLTEAEVRSNVADRSDDFREDPYVITGSASLNDYRRSGYDRGHMAPAGDMGFSAEAMSESFFMSNMSPQNRDLNRGVWRELEEDVRDWAVDYGSLYIVTGPVFGSDPKKIGENGVSVPDYYYKVLLDYQEPEVKAIGFLIPNESTSKSPKAFVESIDNVEAYTGVDFFPELPDEVEEALERNTDTESWF